MHHVRLAPGRVRRREAVGGQRSARRPHARTRRVARPAEAADRPGTRVRVARGLGIPQERAANAGQGATQRVTAAVAAQAWGAALLLVASIVFVAVAWNNLGLAVQMAAMLGATALATWSSAFVARRNLRATTESLGAVASGLVAVDLWAVWQFDVLGVRHLSGPAYPPRSVRSSPRCCSPVRAG